MLDFTFPVNIMIHSLLLFIFLTVFFWKFISKKEKETIQDELSDIIQEQVPKVLKNIDDLDTNKKIDWKELKKSSEKVIEKSQGQDQLIKNNNDNLEKFNFIFIGVFTFVTFFTIFIIINRKQGHVDFKDIILENLIIFSFVGIIEYLFFTKIVLRYVPVEPDFMVNSIIDSTKSNFKNIFD